MTASDDKTARVWDAATGRELRVLRGHEDRVTSAEWAPDGKALVTASDDKTARVWDAATGRELRVLRGHENSVVSAEWAPDGKALVTASDDRTARMWRCLVCGPVNEIADELARLVGRSLTEAECRRFDIPADVCVKK